MAQLPRLTSPYMLIAACRFQNTPTWGGGAEKQGREHCSGVWMSVVATLRDILMPLMLLGEAALSLCSSQRT